MSDPTPRYTTAHETATGHPPGCEDRREPRCKACGCEFVDGECPWCRGRADREAGEVWASNVYPPGCEDDVAVSLMAELDKVAEVMAEDDEPADMDSNRISNPTGEDEEDRGPGEADSAGIYSPTGDDAPPGPLDVAGSWTSFGPVDDASLKYYRARAAGIVDDWIADNPDARGTPVEVGLLGSLVRVVEALLSCRADLAEARAMCESLGRAAGFEPFGLIWRPKRGGHRWQHRARRAGRAYPASAEIVDVFRALPTGDATDA